MSTELGSADGLRAAQRGENSAHRVRLGWSISARKETRGDFRVEVRDDPVAVTQGIDERIGGSSVSQKPFSLSRFGSGTESRVRRGMLGDIGTCVGRQYELAAEDLEPVAVSAEELLQEVQVAGRLAARRVDSH